MVSIEKLEAEIAKERKKQEREEKEKRLRKELYELKNRKELSKIKARKEKFRRAGRIAKKFLKSSAKSIGRGAVAIERARREEETNKRMELIHGVKTSKNKIKKRGIKPKKKKYSSYKPKKYKRVKTNSRSNNDFDLFGYSENSFRIA